MTAPPPPGPPGLADASVHDQATYAQLVAQSGVWALTAGSSQRAGRRTSPLAALGTGLGVVVAIALIAALTVLIHNGRNRSPSAGPRPAAPVAESVASQGNVGATPTPKPSEPTRPPSASASAARNPLVLADFEHGTAGWLSSGPSRPGPAVTGTEWAAVGTHSLTCGTIKAGATIYLSRVDTRSLVARTSVTASVRVAPVGGVAPVVWAKMFVKTGPSWAWADGGATAVTTAGTMVTVSLKGLPDLGDTREIGVQFEFTSAGQVFVDDVTIR